MINRLAAMHAALRARKQQIADAKAATVEQRKRRRSGPTAKQTRLQSGQLGEKADE